MRDGQETREANKTTTSRAHKLSGRVFFDVCEPKSLRSMGGKKYTLLVKNGFSRNSAVRTDDAAEFKSRYLADLCRELCARQEFTTANSPQFIDVSTGMAASVQRKHVVR